MKQIIFGINCYEIFQMCCTFHEYFTTAMLSRSWRNWWSYLLFVCNFPTVSILNFSIPNCSSAGRSIFDVLLSQVGVRNPSSPARSFPSTLLYPVTYLNLTIQYYYYHYYITNFETSSRTIVSLFMQIHNYLIMFY